jgi:hypothetical protein
MKARKLSYDEFNEENDKKSFYSVLLSSGEELYLGQRVPGRDIVSEKGVVVKLAFEKALVGKNSDESADKDKKILITIGSDYQSYAQDGDVFTRYTERPVLKFDKEKREFVVKRSPSRSKSASRMSASRMSASRKSGGFIRRKSHRRRASRRRRR